MDDREWILLNPGPANTTPTVRQALVMPDLCHRESECFEMVRRCRELLVALAGGGPDWAAVLFAGSGTAAVEAVVASVVPPDRGAARRRQRRLRRSHRPHGERPRDPGRGAPLRHLDASRSRRRRSRPGAPARAFARGRRPSRDNERAAESGRRDRARDLSPSPKPDRGRHVVALRRDPRLSPRPASTSSSPAPTSASRACPACRSCWVAEAPSTRWPAGRRAASTSTSTATTGARSPTTRRSRRPCRCSTPWSRRSSS